MKIKVGDMVKLVSGGCGCDTCRVAMENFYEVEGTDVHDKGDVLTEIGMFHKSCKWEMFNPVLENE